MQLANYTHQKNYYNIRPTITNQYKNVPLNKWRKGSTHVVLRYAYFSWPRVKPGYIRRKNILFVFYFFILPLLRNISLSGHFWFIGTSWPNLRAHNFLFVWRSNFILVRLTWNGIYLEMQIIQKNKIRQLWLR